MVKKKNVIQKLEILIYVEKSKKFIFITLDDVLITTLSGKSYPNGIWDFKINWQIWNVLKKINPKTIAILSTQPLIRKGFIKESSFYSKINFISHSLSDYTGVLDIRTRYSITDKWNLGINGDGDDLVDSIILQKDIKEDMIFIGKNNDKDYANKKGIKFIERNELVKLTF